MTRSVDDLLRETIRDLAAESATAPDLAGGALARGRRLRRRRHIATVAAALLLAATATIPYAVLHRDNHATWPSPAAPTAVPTPTTVPASPLSMTEPFRVPGSMVITGMGGYEGGRELIQNLVLDRTTGRYRALPAKFLNNDPSPDGRYVIGDYLGRQELALREIGTGETRWVTADAPPEPQWSPSGDRLVIFRNAGFTVVDPATGHRTDHDIDDQQRCLGYCQYTWLGDGAAVALPQTYQVNTDPVHVTGLAIFDARTGKLLRNLPAPGAPLGENSWSADGRAVLIRPDVPETHQVLIASTADGRPTGGFRANTAFFLPDGTIFGRLGAVVTHYDATGHPMESMTLPQPLDRKELSFGPP
jgi:hypothetical protein